MPSLLGEFSRVALELHYFLGCSPPFNQSKNKLREHKLYRINCPVVHISLASVLPDEASAIKLGTFHRLKSPHSRWFDNALLASL